MFAIYSCAAIYCLASSTVFHTLLCHQNQAVFRRCALLDFAGIGLLVPSSYALLVHTVFRFDYLARVAYMVMYSSFAVISLLVLFHPAFNSEKGRVCRYLYYVTQGVVSMGPFIHAWIAKKLDHLNGLAFYGLFLVPGLDVSGLLFYIFRIPERFT